MFRLAMMRRLARGLPCLLLVTLLLGARTIAPLAAMPSGADLVVAGLQVICHAGDPGEDDAAGGTQAPNHSSMGKCLLCPACSLASQAALPAPGGPAVPAATVRLVALAAPLPPATGPPDRPRRAAQPTGPPYLSV